MDVITSLISQPVRTTETEIHVPFRRAAVLGAGTMGAQIAAHLANAGLEVLLLDMPGQGENRNEIVQSGLTRAEKLRPDPFFDEKARSRVETGNFDDDIGRIEDAEWVIEAVVERLDVKRSLMERVARHAGPDAIISTNTSGIPISEIVDRQPEAFARHFVGTHFFNPPRYLKLLEIIPTDRTDARVVDRLAHFARVHLGKNVVVANDRPYFIGNRIGVFALVGAMRFATDGDYSMEEVDALTGTLIGRPRSATFRTADVVGLDVLQDVLKGMHERLESDESREAFVVPPLIQALVREGAVGSKAGAGFYKKVGGEIHRITDSGGYAPLDALEVVPSNISELPDLEDRLRRLYQDEGRAGAFFRATILDVIAYSARRIPEITANPADVDRAMRWGFGWEMGPFEIWDAIGFSRVLEDMKERGLVLPEWVDRLASEGGDLYRKRGDSAAVFLPEARRYEEQERHRDEISLALIRSDARNVLWENEESVLLDVGESVALFEFRSKGNTLSHRVMQGLLEVVDLVERSANLRGLIIGNDGKNFSVGANLAELAQAAADRKYSAVDGFLIQFQNAIQAVRYCAKPAVVAAHQRVLGGACELLMACPNPVASAEAYVGLVEVGVGLIPAGTGLMRLAASASESCPTPHASHLQPYVQKYFEQVVRAEVSGSAADAVRMGYLNGLAPRVMHDDRRLFVAREEVVRRSNAGYMPPPREQRIRVHGRSMRAAFEVAVDQFRQGGFMSDYDAEIAMQVAHVLTGGDLTGFAEVDEAYLLDLERESFLRLIAEERTQQRIAHMLTHKKPLRN